MIGQFQSSPLPFELRLGNRRASTAAGRRTPSRGAPGICGANSPTHPIPRPWQRVTCPDLVASDSASRVVLPCGTRCHELAPEDITEGQVARSSQKVSRVVFVINKYANRNIAKYIRLRVGSSAKRAGKTARTSDHPLYWTDPGESPRGSASKEPVISTRISSWAGRHVTSVAGPAGTKVQS